MSNFNVEILWKPIPKIDAFKMGAWGDRELTFHVVLLFPLKKHKSLNLYC